MPYGAPLETLSGTLVSLLAEAAWGPPVSTFDPPTALTLLSTQEATSLATRVSAAAEQATSYPIFPAHALLPYSPAIMCPLRHGQARPPQDDLRNASVAGTLPDSDDQTWANPHKIFRDVVSGPSGAGPPEGAGFCATSLFSSAAEAEGFWVFDL
jgi:hypothetical protein